MEPEGSLPLSQQPATFSFPEPDRSNPCSPSHFSKIHFNIILTFTPLSSKWSPTIRFPDLNFVCTSALRRTCYLPCPSQSSLLDCSNNIWRRVQSIKLLVMYSSPLPVTSSLLDPNILLSILSLRSSLNASDQVLYPYITNRQNCSLVYLNLYFWMTVVFALIHFLPLNSLCEQKVFIYVTSPVACVSCFTQQPVSGFSGVSLCDSQQTISQLLQQNSSACQKSRNFMCGSCTNRNE